MKQLKRWSVVAATLAAVFFVSCGGEEERTVKGDSKVSAKDSIRSSMVDSLISLADKAKDYERKFFLADSLEKAGVISSVRANFLRGSSLHSQNKRAASEVY